MSRENYKVWFRKIVREVLLDASRKKGEINLFITFLTYHSHVVLSEDMKLKYPSHMSVILENEYRHLQVFDDHFSVILNFNDVEQNVEIPFDSIISFVDRDNEFAIEMKRNRDEVVISKPNTSQEMNEKSGDKIINLFNSDHSS